MSNSENTPANTTQESTEVSKSDSQPVSGEVEMLDENQLAQMLIQALLPSFAKEIRLQALIAYQIDGENYRSLIVDKSFKREPENDAEKKLESSPSPPNDSGVECADPPVSVTNSVSEVVPQSTSRRKRKFCRPCKIPQSPPSEPTPEAPMPVDAPAEVPEDSQPPCKMPEIESLHLNNETSTAPAPIEPKPQIPILPSTTTTTTLLTPQLTNRIVLPLASTPKVNGNTPRPILPRPIINSGSGVTMAPLQPLLSLPDAQASDHSIENAESDDALSSNRRYGKSFVCNQCKLSFLSLNSLCEHTYSQHKAFRCNFCGAQFTQRSNLQRHSLRHVGFKPFVCRVCRKEYYRKDHLVRHIEVSHPGKDPKKEIEVKLTSAECLDYLDSITQQNNQLPASTPSVEPKKTDETPLPVAAVVSIAPVEPPSTEAA